jgi:hypothetical protein
VQNIQKAVEEDNLKAFSEFKLSIEDLLGLRLKHNLNILQATSYFGAEVILKYLANFLILDEEAKKELIDYREPNGGNMAIHFAVLKGNKRIIDYLLNDFHADPYAVTTNGLSVIHCAAQFERGVLSIEMFSDKEFKFDVNQRDKFQCSPLHFAVLNL